MHERKTDLRKQLHERKTDFTEYIHERKADFKEYLRRKKINRKKSENSVYSSVSFPPHTPLDYKSLVFEIQKHRPSQVN